MSRRHQLSFTPRSPHYIPAEPSNISMFIFMPVLAGYWKQKELTDGTYNYIDLLDIVEAMQVQSENQWRDYESGREN